MSYQPASTVAIRHCSCSADGTTTYMKPAPPVIIIFLTSGRGSNFVLPIKTGASFHTPKSSKNLLVPALEPAGASRRVSRFCRFK